MQNVPDNNAVPAVVKARVQNLNINVEVTRKTPIKVGNYGLWVFQSPKAVTRQLQWVRRSLSPGEDSHCQSEAEERDAQQLWVLQTHA